MATERWRLQSGQYLGEVSALCFLRLPSHISSFPFLFAGSGSQLLLYDLAAGTLIQSFCVFQGIRVHGISSTSFVSTNSSHSSRLVFRIAVFGEKRVKLFNLDVGMALEPQSQSRVCVSLVLLHSLPKFSHWVLDVSFLKNCVTSSLEESDFLAIGCSDNTVRIWDVSSLSFILEVQSPDRCLLYSMRLWGENLEKLHIASGTIYNEVIIWKVVPEHGGLSLTTTKEEDLLLSSSSSNNICFRVQQYRAVHIHKLSGHEGSIFRIVWSSDGSKLVSVSDDRSARIWTFHIQQNDSDDCEAHAAAHVLFGHNARVWDCCISDTLVVTAGEDCTCRIWGLDGQQIGMIKEHIGRGVWRCLYDPNSSLLVTAGFDSAIKVYQLQASLGGRVDEHAEAKEFIDRTELFTIRIPNSSERVGLMDSKSEYVRCLRFTCEDTLYVSTNLGYLYHVKLSGTENIKWTELVRISEEVPIICMDLLSGNLSEDSCYLIDWVALGDGKGNMTMVKIVTDACTPQVNCCFTWPAGRERQLLGTFWCKSLGNRYVFTADPGGVLRMWRLFDSSLSVDTIVKLDNVFLLAEFKSCFGTRVMCLHASVDEEVLVCGDLRGNLIVFPLSKGLLQASHDQSEVKIPPLTYFKGAHGISTVASISVTKLHANQTEVCSTGGDGCICYFEYDRDHQSLEFVGMKQVKELSLIQRFCANKDSADDLGSSKYAAGFASADFMLWNLTTEAKVVQIPCGGWRRPHSCYLGDVPEMKNCFAYVKDETINIRRHWERESERGLFPQNLHMQFHGREMHSLCFICNNLQVGSNGRQSHANKSSCVATGCEDGTVRLTRYSSGVESWSSSKLLGEHIGGSAVRSICSVSKIHISASDLTNSSDKEIEQNATSGEMKNPFLLISVGAKRVLTSWLLRDRKQDNNEESLIEKQNNEQGTECKPSSGVLSSMSFQWLSSDMPARSNTTRGKVKSTERIGSTMENGTGLNSEANSRSILTEKSESESKTYLDGKHDDDWRYLAVTAFLVKCVGSRLTICFIVVACSDATLTLRALILPHRLWFDVALLIPLSCPVFALQHIIIPICPPSEKKSQSGNVYIVISGATDGSIAFWDLTESIEAFVGRLSTLKLEELKDCRIRPRTGRGSQGGRWWRSLTSSISKKESGGTTVTAKAGHGSNFTSVDHAMKQASRTQKSAETRETVCSQAMANGSLELGVDAVDSSAGICELQPLFVLKNVHQSGVNCLHVSGLLDCQSSDSDFLFNIISGGDDQALHCLSFGFSLLEAVPDSKIMIPDNINLLVKSATIKNRVDFNQNQIQNYRIKLIHHDKIASAHSSAIKGVWTDGTWVFSTGLDQRIRCWSLGEHGIVTEHSHIVISVPEPEALDARACDRNCYQIAVAGRGMQMVDFSAT
ncbi:uncharacterized protein LOC119984211 isoform X3 [Tripterygium wilfordii]|uniref:uncharacterized protein LOC119984211 isoform X3 n=1 Tax=Tripterygium wilfordii TaxID=458696 RepID=UPI0018F82C45|nr:uncharacterized protein LOC119984211 isoform X3 [Tripterygium wilfordii]